MHVDLTLLNCAETFSELTVYGTTCRDITCKAKIMLTYLKCDCICCKIGFYKVASFYCFKQLSWKIIEL